MERFILVFMLLWTRSLANNEFCTKGFQIATRYHDCWQQSIFSNKYPDLYERHDMLDAKFLENYATHMCSVVKPEALGCFKKDVSSCPNRKKLIGIADASGGACKGNALNPFFKEHVLKHLIPVTGDRDSPCFTIGDRSYDKCYIAAGKKVLESDKSDSIETFHEVADTFFETYWDCLIDMYKSQAKLCPNWQIPMLLVLQKTALPSLFGMHLKPQQIVKLELKGTSPLGFVNNETKKDDDKKDCDVDKDKKVYLLLQVLTKKPDVNSGDGRLLVELSNVNGDKPIISLGGKTQTDKEVSEFVQILSGPNTQYSLRERRRRRKMEEKRRKKLKNMDSKLKGKDDKSAKKTKKTRKTKPKKNKKKSSKKLTSRDMHDQMIP